MRSSAAPRTTPTARPDTLQELALAVAEVGGPLYDAANDRDGADDRGIVSGFLYRTDRVQLLPASADDPVLGSSPTVEYRSAGLAYNDDVQNPKVLNAVLPEDVDRSMGTDGNDVFTRAPQVGHFRIWRVGIGMGSFVDPYAVSNHFSSGPDSRVVQRTEQATYNAAIVDAPQAADSNIKVAVGGDLNVFPRPDDPFAPGDPHFPSDQLGSLYEQGLHNLWDTILAQVRRRPTPTSSRGRRRRSISCSSRTACSQTSSGSPCAREQRLAGGRAGRRAFRDLGPRSAGRPLQSRAGAARRARSLGKRTGRAVRARPSAL